MTQPNSDNELETILADVEKHAIWYSKNKHSRQPISHDIGMPKHVALERIQSLIDTKVLEARKDELKKLEPELNYMGDQVKVNKRLAQSKKPIK